MPTTDEIRAYWDRSPCGSRHPDPTLQRYFTQPHIPEFATFFRWEGKNVLEVGCGIGTDTLQFAKSALNVAAFDISPESIRLASERAKLSGVTNVQFYCHDISDSELEPPIPAFDLVYSFGVLHHVPRPEKILRAMNSVLKPDGELRIMLYAKYSWKHLFTRQQPEAQAGCPYVKWYSMRAARHLVESCGFRVTSIRKAHIFPWRVPDYIEHRYKRAFPWNIVPHEWLEPYLGHHILLVAVKA